MTLATDDLTGVVLAGGFSRRFGDRDKALARLGGRPLLSRVVGRLDEVTEAVVVNCRADQREAFAAVLPSTVQFVEDPIPDRGPLFGFGTALGTVETEACALVACDTPFLDPRVVADLAGRLGEVGESGTAAIAVGTPDGRADPTQAVFRTDPAEEVCWDLLDSGERRLAALFESLDGRAIPADEVAGDAARSRFDVDTPDDRERAVEMLGEGVVAR